MFPREEMWVPISILDGKRKVSFPILWWITERCRLDAGTCSLICQPSKENGHITSSSAVGNRVGQNPRINTELKLTYCYWTKVQLPTWKPTLKKQVLVERKVCWRVLRKHGPLEKGMAASSAFLPGEPHEQHEKARRYDTERWTPQVGRCPICYWRRVEK